MGALIRLGAIAIVAGAVYYLVKRLTQQKAQKQLRVVPFCPRCESNRQVVSHEQDVWYCTSCKEHF